MLFSELIFGPNWGFQFLGLGTEKLSKLGILNRKLGNVVQFLVLIGSCGTEKGWNGESCGETEVEWIFTATHPATLLKEGTPWGVVALMSVAAFQWYRDIYHRLLIVSH